MTVLELWSLVNTGGLPFALALIVFAGWRGWFVWGRDHDALEARRVAEKQEYEQRITKVERERDDWQRAFLRVAGVAESVAGALMSPDAQVPHGGGSR